MSKIKVLIVEDDPMIADIVQRFTQAVEGYTVIGIARNGESALEVIRKTSVDLVVLDIFLPVINGIDVLAALRREEREVDFVIVTAAEDSKTVSKILRHGVIAYITKPFKFERFRSVLEAYRGFYRKTCNQRNINQKDIDNLMAAPQFPHPAETPKNLNAQTMDAIINFLVTQKKFLSAEEVASGMGLSRGTVRRYLEFLVELGQVKKAMDYLSVGRPVNRFQICQEKTKEDRVARIWSEKQQLASGVY